MEKITDFFSELWEIITKGSLSQVILSCHEEDYEFAMGFKKTLHSYSTDVGVKLVAGEKLTLDEDTVVDLIPGTMAITYIHDGNWLVRPSMETHTMTFEKEE